MIRPRLIAVTALASVVSPISRTSYLPQGINSTVLTLICALLLAPLSWGQSASVDQELRSIREVRALLTDELAQYEKTLDILLPEGARPEDSSNPAVRNLSAETIRIRKRLISITQREVALVKERIAQAKKSRESNGAAGSQGQYYSLEDEAEDVARLLALLTQYYADLQESLMTMPTREELSDRELAQLDAANLAKIPFSTDKVRLNGAEGITALAKFSQRLSDHNIPESRRDIAPICGIRTRLYGSLISSEKRSLKPVGKNQYIARVRLQPGETTLRIQSHKWQLKLPENIAASDYLVTLFLPRSGKPELHVFSVDDLLAQELPYIPAWLPDELNLSPPAG